MAIERACYEMDTACLDIQFEILQRKRGWPKERAGANDGGAADNIFSPPIPEAGRVAIPSVCGSGGVGGGLRRGVTKSASGRRAGMGSGESGGGDARIRLGGAAANKVGGAAAVVAVVIKKEYVRKAFFCLFCF